MILIDKTHGKLQGFKLCPLSCSLSLAENLALKSLIIKANEELQEVAPLNTVSKFERKFSNSKTFLVGDLHTGVYI